MFTLADTPFRSRLFTGTGKFASTNLMLEAIAAAGSELVTLAMRRVDMLDGACNDALLPALRQAGVRLLPNTSGAKTADEALFAARLAREALGTHWIKLEIHPDMQYLLPDPIETLKAAERLVKEGFVVLPYCSADPVLCRRLTEAGCAAVMPLGSPIGSNQGLKTRDFLQIIIEQAKIPVVVDAGIGAPSQALEALEMGADAVLVNTAIAVAQDPVAMAHAFRLAMEAGEQSRQAGLAPRCQQASASSPLTGFLSPPMGAI
ncbi:thiazole synthase [Candidatus Williamhamiltonella defendens]|uniref:thiazole synthase n=1 Tax=Candidatus Williamhamiltonella defendens TaxID=138072 RepID=UPI00130EA8A5|nr:thiazole synthase [Candidatus Hamiltonella defensa]